MHTVRAPEWPNTVTFGQNVLKSLWNNRLANLKSFLQYFLCNPDIYVAIIIYQVREAHSSFFFNPQVMRRLFISAPEPTPIESNNWLIYTRYARKEFEICKLIIEEELIKSKGCNEYASYILVNIYIYTWLSYIIYSVLRIVFNYLF